MLDLEQEMSRCRVCPRKCGADREHGKTGYCKAPSGVTAARAALHFWEEPCISGTTGSGTVFFSGCNLRCVYCQNHHIAEMESGKVISIGQLSDIFLELQAQNANNINLVTPSHYVLQIREALLLAKEKGLTVPIVYNCGGYESVEALQALDGLIDIYLTDFKYMVPSLAKGNVVIPFGDLYEVDYDETYQGEEIKAMSAVAGKLYIVTEKTRDDLLNLHIF